MIPPNMVWETHASQTTPQARAPPPSTAKITPPKATNQSPETKPQSHSTIQEEEIKRGYEDQDTSSRNIISHASLNHPRRGKIKVIPINLVLTRLTL